MVITTIEDWEIPVSTTAQKGNNIEREDLR
jgi:hypothetical protein